jgi:hypothetical protein
MTEKEVLDFKPTPRLEQIGNKRPEQVDDGKHRIGSCSDSLSVANLAGLNFRESQVSVFFRIGLDVGSAVKVRKPHAEHMFSGCSDS